MKLAIMQPYFMPYIGYFQLIAAVDQFVVYDNIKYTKKGWINRNRFLKNGSDAVFSLPLKKDSDSLDIGERVLAADFNKEKLLNQIKGAYHSAPHFDQTFPMLERVVRHPDENLFRYLHNTIVQVSSHLGISTPMKASSEVEIDHGLQAQAKVLALCDAMGASLYVNAIGGTTLYSKEVFAAKGIELRFLRSLPFEYPQYGAPFVPRLSIIDALMFNPLPVVQRQITNGFDYE